MLNKILTPLDGSTLANVVLPHVIALTGINGTTVTLFQVLETKNRSSAEIDPVDWALQKNEAESYLNETGERLQQLHLKTETIVREGNAADRIIEYAQKADVDLIALSSHGKGGLSGWNLSSVVNKVIHRARKSTLIIPAHRTSQHSAEGELAPVRYRRILVPLDGSPRAECVLPLASALARSTDAELVLAHVVTRPELIQRMPLSDEDHHLVDQIVKRNTDEATRYFEQLSSRLSPTPTTYILEEDNVERALLKLVDREAIDLVILAAHGHSGHNGQAYGHLAISFIDYGGVPLYIYQDLGMNEIEPLYAERALQNLAIPNGHRINAYEYAVN